MDEPLSIPRVDDKGKISDMKEQSIYDNETKKFFSLDKKTMHKTLFLTLVTFSTPYIGRRIARKVNSS